MLKTAPPSYKNNKLSCINIFDHFVSIKLPAEFIYDLVVVCGPGWDEGKHNISIKARSGESEPVEIGNIDVNIPNKNFVYNALAQNLKIQIGAGIPNITFLVYRDGEQVIERTYNINTLFTPMDNKQAQEQLQQAQNANTPQEEPQA